MKDIKRIAIKRTTKGTPREIKIISSTNPDTYVSGLDDFERFAHYLVASSPTAAAVKERREHIEYDHPLFYVFFGILCSVAAVYTVRLLVTLDATILKLIFACFVVYVLGLVAYLVAKKPVASRYGRK